MSEYDSDDDQPTSLFPNSFMFGNVDKDGNLESSVFDEVTKNQLASLNIEVGSFVRDLTEEEKKNISLENVVSESERSADAVDYSDITELASEDSSKSKEKLDDLKFSSPKRSSPLKKSPVKTPQQQQPSSSSRVDGGGSDFILPSIVSLTSHQDSSHSSPDSKKSFKKSGKFKKSASKHEKKRKKKLKLKQQQKRLAEEKAFQETMKTIEAKVNAQDIDKLFPEFRENQTLRFLRLFHNKNVSSFPTVWKSARGVRKKKHKGAESAESAAAPSSRCNLLQPWRVPSPPLPQPEDCLTDDEMTLLKPLKPKRPPHRHLSDHTSTETSSKNFPWKDSPAALWYNMIGAADNDEHFEYGFRLKPESYDGNEKKSGPQVTNIDEFPSIDHFYMVSQSHWEDDIIWDSDQRNKPDKKLQPAHDNEESFKLRVDRAAQAGWIPSSTQRALMTSGNTGMKNSSSIQSMSMDGSNIKKPEEKETTPMSSIFPIDNYNLIYGNWEKDIIWDDQNMDHIPEPTIFRYDPNDENIILELPDEPKPSAKQGKDNITKKDVKKKGGKNAAKEQEEETQVLIKKDPWNLSNDEFYESKKSTNACLALSMNSVLQHSTPAMELHPMFFNTSMRVERLQAFHRPQFRRYQHGPMSKPGAHNINCVTKYLRKKAKQREQERKASGGGEVFFMRNPQDLSALDGHLILAEFSEEYPPLLSQVGMAVKIKNYYKRKPDNNCDPPKYRYGDSVISHSTSQFLGKLSPGESLQTFECNMYRAPIYEHRVTDTDFLLIRTRHNYFIRVVPFIFTVGQQCPLMEVPAPCSKKATNHIRDFLQVFIYRMFAKNTDHPKKIRMEEVKKAFPQHSETSIRKRLKLCAEFNRTGQDSNWWVIRKDFRLPSEEEMRAMVSPEQTCSYYSMIAAEQRLKDAGYGDNLLNMQDREDNEEEHQMKVEEEVLNAPWQTTRAFISAVRGKCLLQVTGPADPTGCGEGFSYVKVPMKPQQVKQSAESVPAPPKKQVTGTDADLRRLSLTAAKQLLRKFGVADEEIKKLSRWEVIDVVRTMSTEQARSGDTGVSKYARGTRFSIAEHQERYKEECQRLFELQNKVLSSRHVDSTDNDSTSGEDTDYEEMGKNIENLLSNKKSSAQLNIEQEEEERKELLEMMNKAPSSSNNKKEDETKPVSFAGGCLNITRHYVSDDGTEFTRVETVRRTEVIEAYVRLRTHKDVEGQIRKLFMSDESTREEMRREKRRLQEQLRRIKRNDQKNKTAAAAASSSHHHSHHDKSEKKKDKEKKLKDAKLNPNIVGMKCGACGKTGHMRTNRACPMYRSSAVMDSNVGLTEAEEEEIEKKNLSRQPSLVKIDGVKLIVSKDLVKQSEPEKVKPIRLKLPTSHSNEVTSPPSSPSSPILTNLPKSERKKKRKNQLHCDYLQRLPKKKERKRADPVVSLSTLFENIINGLRELPDTELFRVPVNPRKVVDYLKIVKNPMDLQTMRDNLRKHTYLSRADFLEHIDLIHFNSYMYNGGDHRLTAAAEEMKTYTKNQFRQMEDKLMRLEKEINPLLDDDDQMAFSLILENIINNKVENIKGALNFALPMNKSETEYYQKIKNPMALSTIKKNIHTHQYRDRVQFMRHIELLLLNSISYYGSDHEISIKAREIVDVCRAALDEQDVTITQLENDIAAAEKAAEAEVADMEGGQSSPIPMDLDNLYDEDSNMSIAPEEDKNMANYSDVENAPDASMDAELLKAFEDAGNDASAASKSGQQDDNQGLFEDLYLSDGEMSPSEDDESEVEGDNPFAATDSDVSDEVVTNSQDVPNNNLMLSEDSNDAYSTASRYVAPSMSNVHEEGLTSSDDD